MVTTKESHKSRHFSNTLVEALGERVTAKPGNFHCMFQVLPDNILRFCLVEPVVHWLNIVTKVIDSFSSGSDLLRGGGHT